jgi:hypothetical protein
LQLKVLVSTIRQLSRPLNLADLFALLFDELPEEPFRDPLAIDDLLRAPENLKRVDEIAQAALTGSLDLEALAAELDQADSFVARLVVLRGLDEALASANPWTDNTRARQLDALRELFLRTGNLTSDSVVGALLPRRTQPGRPIVAPSRPMDAFVHVLRVSPAIWAQTTFAIAPRGLDFDDLELGGGLVVGCAPLLERLEEMTVTLLPNTPPYRSYSIEPNRTPQLERRITELLAVLDRSDALIAMLPELVLSPTLLDYWRDLLINTPRSPDSRLRWLFVGTGHFLEDGHARPYNRGYLLERDSGIVLLQQEKMAEFTLRPRQLAEWGLEDMLGNKELVEAIALGTTLHVLESRAGRFAFLICEDLGRIPAFGPHVIELGVSHIFTPVFADVTQAWYWEHQRAREYLEEVAAHVVVVNSLVVRNRRLERSGGVATNLPPGSSIHVGRDGFRIGEHANGRDVVCFRLA